MSGLRDEFGILISGCFDVLKGKVIRIGHMGENANKEDLAQTLAGLQKILEARGIKLTCKMKDEFLLSC